MSESRGKLKIYLGYAAGVGKTWHMLDDAQHAAAAGADIVVGYFESHGRRDTIAKTEGLEVVPRRKVDYRGTVFEDMDTDAIIRRRPKICVVDEFAHTNVPGSEREKRWQDVEELLDHGIGVITAINVQHIAEKQDQVERITGKRARYSVPESFLRKADEIEVVDAPTDTLAQVRELALLLAADVVEHELGEYLDAHGTGYDLALRLRCLDRAARLTGRTMRAVEVGDEITGYAVKNDLCRALWTT